MNFKCPRCGAEVQKAAMVFATQTQSGSSGGVTIGNKGHVSYHTGARQNQSQLAAALAPPKKPDWSRYYGPAFVVSTIGSLLLSSIVINNLRQSESATFTPVAGVLLLVTSFVVIAAVVRFADQLYRAAIAKYELQLSAWNALWICMRCGTLERFEVEA